MSTPSSLRRKLLVVVSALCVLVGLGPATAVVDTPTRGSSGAGDRYFPTYGNGGYDVLHYAVHDRMALKKQRLSGFTRIRARATKSLRSFNLDLVLRVDSVTVDGQQARHRRPNRHELMVVPKKPIAAGKVFTVRVAYHGKPGKIGWNGERPWTAANKREAVAMGQPQIAAWWFPANDHPRDKARFDIHINVPRGKKAIANGKLAKVTRGKKRTVWHWRADEAMTPYLAFFAAGDFGLHRGRTKAGLPYVYAVSRQLKKGQRKQALRFLRTTPKVIAFLEKWLGDYPFSTTGGVVTGTNVSFALENQTRPTYFYAGGAGSSWLVAHEIAHQWFGDKVALDTWRDIWLNEGFATYFETLWADNYGWSTPQKWLVNSWQAQGAGFWRLPIGNPGGHRIFDYPIYERGAMTVQALRHRIGDQAFKRLLRLWLADRENGSTAEFIELAEQVSGEDLDGFFDAWLFGSKRPARTAANGLV